MGGVQSFWGPVVGVLALELIDSQVGRLTQHSLLAVGALAVARVGRRQVAWVAVALLRRRPR